MGPSRQGQAPGSPSFFPLHVCTWFCTSFHALHLLLYWTSAASAQEGESHPEGLGKLRVHCWEWYCLQEEECCPAKDYSTWQITSIFFEETVNQQRLRYWRENVCNQGGVVPTSTEVGVSGSWCFQLLQLCQDKVSCQMLDNIINHQGIISLQSWERLTNPTRATCKVKNWRLWKSLVKL